ncbi:HAD family hydrolase [Thiomicrorhabdus sp. 6S3-12]|uniref:HAD family hydrolase n=1 Tax=Thiomicrorhabdus sp. 6S3-12 TaxID=2819681 RepID=UPI001AACADEA|nr:HAD family hydrolase [Thiomicrorhabdus sp. 6S3-12]MBO1923436.1 HAD family hydrolase [Thiomicrorhabdus sp. 6S3-12]
MARLVVIDLDGTLLNSDHQIGDLTVRTLQALYARGCELMIATGRHFQDVYLIAQKIKVPVSFITSNGARIHDHHGRLLYENHIPQELVAKVLDISADYAVHRNIYQGDVWLVEEENKPLLDIHKASGFEYQRVDFSELDPEHIDKFYFNAPHAKLVPLERKLKEALGDQLYITFTTEIYLEVMNKGVSKGKALAQLCSERGIDSSEVVAFGDGFNDIDMLQWVGRPVVMANANEALKEQVPYADQALSNAEEGVALYLQQNLLSE